MIERAGLSSSATIALELDGTVYKTVSPDEVKLNFAF